MPFAVRDPLQYKRNERQIREIHERQYLKYVTNLRQQPFHSNLSRLPREHIQEIERSRLRNLNNRNTHYDRIQRENRLLSERLFDPNKQAMIDTRNHKYQQNLDVFDGKRSQQRNIEYRRIRSENELLTKRISSVQGQMMDKQQCDREWQRHIQVMKHTSDYPENIDRFVSNQKRRQRRHTCHWQQQWNHVQQASHVTERPLSMLLRLAE